MDKYCEDYVFFQKIKFCIFCQVLFEEIIGEILVRYIDINQYVSESIWKVNCVKSDGIFLKVDFNKILEENGLLDERLEFESFEMGILYYLFCIYIYYNDDILVD